MFIPTPDPPPSGAIHPPPPPYDFESTARAPDPPADATPPDVALPRAATPGERVHDLNLPPEVSLAEAAAIANCDKKTIIRYMRDGLLEWRNIAPPSSSRPTYRIKLASVIALRTSYHQDSPVRQHGRDDHAEAARKHVCRYPDLSHPQRQFKHIRLSGS